MPEVTQLSLSEQIQLLRAGEISSQELTDVYIERINNLEPEVHAFISFTPEKALKQAQQADSILSEWRKNPSKDLPPLTGIPIAVKDVLNVAGVPCTCGSRILENFIPPYNATAVQRLLEAGVNILGKTNTDEFAMGSSTENSAYGTTHNPWDLSRVPGGSSGGSAAAVAARMAPIALGTDTGGSIRQPASFCGITGLKPTYGRVSRFGLTAYGSSLDVVGVLGKNAQDVNTIFSLMAGKDPLDSTTTDKPVPITHFNTIEDKSFSALRIGVPDEYFIKGIQPDVEKRVKEAIQTFESLGAEIIPIHMPHTKHALPVYYLIAPAEASANLARYDGLRYGPRVPAENVWEIIERTRSEKFGTEVKRRIMLGTYALSAGYYDAYYGQAQKVRTLIKQDFDFAFEKVDLIAAPVAPTTAFTIGSHTNDPLAMYLEDIFTLPANLAGVPGISFPVGFDKDGLPVGMQLMANQFNETLLLQAADAYQSATKWHRQYPNI